MSTYGVWLSAAGMKVNEHRQTLLANNMANMQTTGFKQDLAVVSQRRVESREGGTMNFVHPVLDNMSGGVHVRPAYTDLGQGPLDATGKALDVAIRGEGFLAVSDGEVTRYTRNGEFALNAEGQLVLANEAGRWFVLDEAGLPIRIDSTLGNPTVSADGTIRQAGQDVGKLALTRAENLRMLRKVGENLFESSAEEMVPAAGHFVPGSLEGSNFNVMQGLAAMIGASRAYQMNATMIQLQDQITGQAVSTLGRVA
jgi:flagellar basal-body rod protein FlgG